MRQLKIIIQRARDMGSPEIFNKKATEFKDVVKTPAFIDHSKLMKFVMSEKTPDAVFIAAPSRACKTANLQMIKTGLEIETKNGEPLRSDLLNRATDVEQLKVGENYKLFEIGKCEILKDASFVLEHFGRYPVVYLDFMNPTIRSYEEAVDHCRVVIRKAFQHHDYLWETGKIYEKEKKNKTAQKVCEDWCSRSKEVDVKQGLADLCAYLHSRFGRKVVVLIDEYDAVITSAMAKIKDFPEVQDVIDLMSGIVGFVVKGEYADKYVQKVVITGISIRSGIGLSNTLSVVQKYHFATEKELIPFYGIVKSDLEKLLDKLRNDEKVSQHENFTKIFSQSDADILADLQKRFNGYYCEGSNEEIYSLWFVLHHLSGEKIEILKGPLVQTLLHLFRISKVAKSLRDLLNKKYVRITPPSYSELTVKYVHEVLQQNEIPHLDTLFALLKEEGHLKVVQEPSDEQELAKEETGPLKLEIVNSTIRTFYKSLFNDALVHLGFNSYDFQDCANAFVKMCDADNCEQSLKKFFESFEKVCKSFKKVSIMKEIWVQLVLVNILILTRFEKLDPESHVKNEDTQKSGFIDVFWENKDRTTLVLTEIKWNKGGKNPGSENEKRSRNIGDKHKTAISGLVQILGKDSTLYESLENHLKFTSEQKDRLNGYVSLLQKEEHKNKKFLLVSISVDGNYKPSMCIVINKKNPEPKDVMVLSRHEVVDFPDLYKKCSTTIALEEKND